MKSWKTTVAGIIGGLPQILNGIIANDWGSVGAGLALIVVGLFAKDHDVSGGN